MGKGIISGASNSPMCIVFTDLDGTLLDQDTYRWEEAAPALKLCENLQVPVVLASSKTRAEMDILHAEMTLSAPFITENGGGIYFPKGPYGHPTSAGTLDNGMWKWPLGISYSQLTKGLQEIRNELGWQIKGFSEMSVEEISDLTGLDLEDSRLAAMREYDEPFLIKGRSLAEVKLLSKTAEKKGFTVTSGGRFYHLKGHHDKGKAMDKLLSWFRQIHGDIVSAALGDSANDFPMLKRADYPVLVRSQRNFSGLKKEIPRLTVTDNPGPLGWNKAVLDILNKYEEKGDVGHV